MLRTGAVRVTSAPALAVAGLAVLLLVAFVMYHASSGLPFEQTDFGETLPLLRGSDSVADGYAALSPYYAEHGRFFPVTLAMIATKWALFGWNTAAWQLSTYATMCVIVIGTFLLLRRLGASAPGALAGAALLVVGEATWP